MRFITNEKGLRGVSSLMSLIIVLVMAGIASKKKGTDAIHCFLIESSSRGYREVQRDGGIEKT